MPLLNRKAYHFEAKPADLKPTEEVRVSGACRTPVHAHKRLSSAMAAATRAQGRPARRTAPPRCRSTLPARCPPPPRRASLSPTRQVWVIEATGEVFRSYEAFLSKKGLYEQEVWSCRYTGKGGLTLEQALAAEKKAVAALEAVSAPASSAAQPPLLRRCPCPQCICLTLFRLLWASAAARYRATAGASQPSAPV